MSYADNFRLEWKYTSSSWTLTEALINIGHLSNLIYAKADYIQPQLTNYNQSCQSHECIYGVVFRVQTPKYWDKFGSNSRGPGGVGSVASGGGADDGY